MNVKRRIWKRYLYLFVLGLAIYIGEKEGIDREAVNADVDLIKAFEKENQTLIEEDVGNIEDNLWLENQTAKQGSVENQIETESEISQKELQEKLLVEQIENASLSNAQGDEESAASDSFVPHEKQTDYDWEGLKEYKNLIATFYAIDANTSSNADQLNLDVLLGKDMTIDKDLGPYQILIYHSHSKEAFVDSREGVREDTIVGVGERLTQLLTEYGYSVLHHTAEYDTFRDDAYAVALPEMEKLLKENPSIQVVIDLHRDAGVKGVKRVVEMDGKECATFMLFNGMSYNRKTGSIKYLENPNLADNLSFSFQVQVKAGQYYPGLTRKIYLKGYRYNMHLMPKTLLIELGDSNNTVQQAMNTCEPLAHILHMVLSGE